MDPKLSPLARASAALWLATVSLMTAFMHTEAPAHRYLMARRIARNFVTLCDQECFAADCRNTFSRLAVDWDNKATRIAADQHRPRGGLRIAAVLKSVLHRLCAAAPTRQ